MGNRLKFIDKNGRGASFEVVIEAKYEKPGASKRRVGKLEVRREVQNLSSFILNLLSQILEDGRLPDLSGTFQDENEILAQPRTQLINDIPINNVRFLIVYHEKINITHYVHEAHRHVKNVV